MYRFHQIFSTSLLRAKIACRTNCRHQANAFFPGPLFSEWGTRKQTDLRFVVFMRKTVAAERAESVGDLDISQRSSPTSLQRRRAIHQRISPTRIDEWFRNRSRLPYKLYYLSQSTSCIGDRKNTIFHNGNFIMVRR